MIHRPPTDRRRGPLERAAGRLAALGAGGLAALAVNRVTGVDRIRWLIGLQAITRVALLPAHLLVPIGLALRRPDVALTGAVVAGYHLALTRSARGRGRPDAAEPGAAPIRVVAANLLLTNPVIERAGAELDALAADVLVLHELTREHLAGLRGSGALDRFEHSVVAAEPGFHGAGLFSRWPLTGAEVIDLGTVPLPVATIQTPDGPLRVAAVHAKNPGALGELRRWQRQLVALADLVRRSEFPIVLVGDFNATADHRDFRRLLRVGLRDAYDVAGRGVGATWPVWNNLMPPLLRLDHALVSDGIAVRTATVEDTAGSDHRRLIVDLSLAGRAEPSTAGNVSARFERGP